MTAADPARKLAQLLKKLKPKADGEPEAARPAPSPPEWADPLVDELIFSFLSWDAGLAPARNAIRKLHEAVVDYNELRVFLPDELAQHIGARYPRAAERAQRLRASLADLYKREHAVTLRHLADAPKRDARLYLESLEGMPHYVAARVILIGLGGHAIPVDERILDILVAESITDENSTPEAASAWLERHVRAADALSTYLLLQALADEGRPRREPRPAAPKKAPAARKKQNAKSPE